MKKLNFHSWLSDANNHLTIRKTRGVYSSEKLCFFDKWELPGNEIKVESGLHHLIFNYCRNNEENSPDYSSKKLTKRSWAQFNSNKFPVYFPKTCFDFELNNPKIVNSPNRKIIDTKGGRRILSRINQKNGTKNREQVPNLAKSTKR